MRRDLRRGLGGCRPQAQPWRVEAETRTGGPLAAIEAEAASLASSTPWSRDQWRSVLLLLDGHRYRDDIVNLVKTGAGRMMCTPYELAAFLLAAIGEEE